MEERKVEILNSENGEWEETRFMKLKTGDIFRLFDSGPNPIETGKATKALASPYKKKGIPTILCEEVAPIDEKTGVSEVHEDTTV